MELEEGLLVLTGIESSTEYKSEGETNIGSILLLYILFPPTLPLFASLYNTMSLNQVQAEQIIQQYQK